MVAPKAAYVIQPLMQGSGPCQRVYISWSFSLWLEHTKENRAPDMIML